ncbi:esterase/lipase family protein [Streptomyces sp. NPDC020800]|uniref:esterase/lipase family protein n=1 Tax=Streptomyces sp. NPDC020800 TaxID=3365092 RepID=UPI0037AC673F
MSEATESPVIPFTIGDPLDSPSHPVEVPDFDEEWTVDKGFTWVFYGKDNSTLTRPVIIADGFNHGRSKLKELYEFLEGEDYPFISELRRRNMDVILLGFDNRTDSILTNSKAVEGTIREAIARRTGNERLIVGGFSMGGLIARYTLARMETDFHEDEHQTGVYFSFDTPHRGASIPAGVQAFAYLLPYGLDLKPHPFEQQMNSLAARQMLWQHYDKQTQKIGVAPERTALLNELDRVGQWPQIPRRLAVANGRGDGIGLPDVEPGEVALRLDIRYPGTTFYTQAQGDDVTVAYLNRKFPATERTITTSGFPELDGAPGGTLATYEILADSMTEAGGEADLRHPHVCFVPSVSAVDILDFGRQEDLYARVHDLDPAQSGLHEFRCSSRTTPHTLPTEELCTWLMDRFQ